MPIVMIQAEHYGQRWVVRPTDAKRAIARGRALWVVPNQIAMAVPAGTSLDDCVRWADQIHQQLQEEAWALQRDATRAAQWRDRLYYGRLNRQRAQMIRVHGCVVQLPAARRRRLVAHGWGRGSGPIGSFQTEKYVGSAGWYGD